MAIKKVTEIPTIDVVRVSVQVGTGTEYVLDTASKIGVEPQIETQDAKKLIIKGVLKSQQPEKNTLTGNKITMTDNVFAPELVQILQGGIIRYWTSAEHTTEGTEVTTFGVSGYTPPVAGSDPTAVSAFKLKAYSAQYDAAGNIVQYECIEYPNCKGVPIAFGSEDGSFRAPEYTINSAPDTGAAPYDIKYMATLPAIV
jgi:hypothetical protein